MFCSPGYLSESDAEEGDGGDNKVTLPQPMSTRGAHQANEQAAVRLSEIGPRLSLKLVKIEDGIGTGEVLFHDHVIKSSEEREATRRRKEEQV